MPMSDVQSMLEPALTVGHFQSLHPMLSGLKACLCGKEKVVPRQTLHLGNTSGAPAAFLAEAPFQSKVLLWQALT